MANHLRDTSHNGQELGSVKPTAQITHKEVAACQQ